MCLNNLSDLIFADMRLVDGVLDGKAIINLHGTRDKKSISPSNVVSVCICHDFGAALLCSCVLVVPAIIHVWHLIYISFISKHKYGLPLAYKLFNDC